MEGNTHLVFSCWIWAITLRGHLFTNGETVFIASIIPTCCSNHNGFNFDIWLHYKMINYIDDCFSVDTIKPILKLTKSPKRTYSNATITWTVSEPVNTSFEVRGPSDFYRNTTQEGGWTGINLPPGSFTLTVMVTDTSGNVAWPSIHVWINGNVCNESSLNKKRFVISGNNIFTARRMNFHNKTQQFMLWKPMQFINNGS